MSGAVNLKIRQSGWESPSRCPPRGRIKSGFSADLPVRGEAESEAAVPEEGKKKAGEGQTVDALAPGGYEGRDKLRKVRGRCK